MPLPDPEDQAGVGRGLARRGWWWVPPPGQRRGGKAAPGKRAPGKKAPGRKAPGKRMAPGRRSGGATGSNGDVDDENDDDGPQSSPMPGDDDDDPESSPMPGDDDDDPQYSPMPGDDDDDPESSPMPGDDDDDPQYSPMPDENDDDASPTPTATGGSSLQLEGIARMRGRGRLKLGASLRESVSKGDVDYALNDAEDRLGWWRRGSPLRARWRRGKARSQASSSPAPGGDDDDAGTDDDAEDDDDNGAVGGNDDDDDAGAGAGAGAGGGAATGGGGTVDPTLKRLANAKLAAENAKLRAELENAELRAKLERLATGAPDSQSYLRGGNAPRGYISDSRLNQRTGEVEAGGGGGGGANVLLATVLPSLVGPIFLLLVLGLFFYVRSSKRGDSLPLLGGWRCKTMPSDAMPAEESVQISPLQDKAGSGPEVQNSPPPPPLDKASSGPEVQIAPPLDKVPAAESAPAVLSELSQNSAHSLHMSDISNAANLAQFATSRLFERPAEAAPAVRSAAEAGAVPGAPLAEAELSQNSAHCLHMSDLNSAANLAADAAALFERRFGRSGL